MKITLDIPDAAISKHKDAFFRDVQKPTNPEDGEEYTDLGWLKEVVRQDFARHIRRGYSKFAKDAVDYEGTDINIT